MQGVGHRGRLCSLLSDVRACVLSCSACAFLAYALAHCLCPLFALICHLQALLCILASSGAGKAIVLGVARNVQQGWHAQAVPCSPRHTQVCLLNAVCDTLWLLTDLHRTCMRVTRILCVHVRHACCV